MSVATSRQERAAAQARLETLPTEVLERDLRHWTLTAFDTAEKYEVAEAHLHSLRQAHQDEQVWIELHAGELRRRLARAKEGGRS